MSKSVGDFFVERLYEWGVRTIFGYPGDGINGVLGALDRAEGKIQFIQVRHEEMAAFMAAAHAKFTGEPGVCLSTGGPGAAHLVTGLYDAKCDHVPVLAICGQAPTTARGAHYQQELNLERLFQDVADYVYEASQPSQVRHLLDRAMRTALGRNGVSVLVLPNDLQEKPYEDPPRKHGSVFSGIGYTKPRVVPYEADLQQGHAIEDPALVTGPPHPAYGTPQLQGLEGLARGDGQGDTRALVERGDERRTGLHVQDRPTVTISRHGNGLTERGDGRGRRRHQCATGHLGQSEGLGVGAFHTRCLATKGPLSQGTLSS